MKPSVQILLTVVIVAAGLFVYDAVRAPPGGEPEPRDAAVLDRPDAEAAEPPPARAEATAPSLGAVLEGTGDELWRASVDERIAELEARLLAARGGAEPDTAGDGEGTDPLGLESAVVASKEEADELRRKRLQRFRAMLEAVERQRRREKAAWQVKAFLDKLDLVLTDDETRRVVAVTLDYQGRWARTTKGMPAQTEEQKEARRGAYREIWVQYGRALEDVAPRAEVDKILQGLQEATSRGQRVDGK